MTPSWFVVPLLHTLEALAGSSVMGVIIGALIAYLAQQRGASRADRRALRDAKARRLEEAYAALARESIRFRDVLHMLYPFHLDDETPTHAAARHVQLNEQSDMLKDVEESLTVALITLRLRSDAAAVVQICARYGDAIDRYTQLVIPLYRQEEQIPPPDQVLALRDDIVAALKQVDAIYDELLPAMRASIESIEQPL